MTLSVSLRLSCEEKLAALRKLDPHARWESLDDLRYCTRCDQVISGRQIEVAGGRGAQRPLRLQCPTTGCTATPEDWTTPPPRATRTRSAMGDGDGAISAGYVQIRPTSEGISISHNGRAAVVKGRSGRTLPLRDIAQLNDAPAPRRRWLSWMARQAAAMATDSRSVLKLLRPAQRGHFHPLH